MSKFNNSFEVTAQKIGNAYLFGIAIADAIEVLEIPDPSQPFPGNRRVNKKHAQDFGDYWESNYGNWIVPPLLVDSAIALTIEPASDDGLGSDFVRISLTRSPQGDLKILDGQHRILGWYLKRLDLQFRKREELSSFNRAVLASDPVAQERSELLMKSIDVQLGRFKSEKIAINLIDDLDELRHQQYFVDIAKNALGINKTVQAKFDNSSVVNRVMQHLLKTDELLDERVDLEKTTCSGANPHLLSVVNVSDIVRHACFGVNTRVTAKKEVAFEDDAVLKTAREFFNVVRESIPQLQLLINGEVSAQKFRELYLLGSGTIWRGLAGAFYKGCVTVSSEEGALEISKTKLRSFALMLKNLSDDMTLPISSSWFSTGLFPNQDSKAPSSRAQDLSALVNLFYSRMPESEIP